MVLTQGSKMTVLPYGNTSGKEWKRNGWEAVQLALSEELMVMQNLRVLLDIPENFGMDKYFYMAV